MNNKPRSGTHPMRELQTHQGLYPLPQRIKKMGPPRKSGHTLEVSLQSIHLKRQVDIIMHAKKDTKKTDCCTLLGGALCRGLNHEGWDPSLSNRLRSSPLWVLVGGTCWRIILLGMGLVNFSTRVNVAIGQWGHMWRPCLFLVIMGALMMIIMIDEEKKNKKAKV